MADYSCYIMVQNNSAHPLTLNGSTHQGSWRTNFPQTVPPHGSTQFLQLSDPSGPYGAAGRISIQVGGTNAGASADFSDGYWGANSCTALGQGLTSTMSWSYTGATGSPSNFQPGVPGTGHPVYLKFVFSDSAAN